MSPFGPPGFGAQWSEESVELARERDERLLSEADRRAAKREARRRSGGGAVTHALRRLLGRTSQEDSGPPES